MRLKILIIFLLISILSTTILYATEGISVTIYNTNLALIKDIRAIKFVKGLQEITFVHIPSQIIPSSVHFNPLNNSGDIIMLEQNYEYDLVGTSKLLDKYIDNDIKIITRKDAEVFTGKLLTADNSSILISGSDNNVYSINREEVLNLEFPSLPGGLITKPTLMWKISSQDQVETNVEVSYLTNGLSWKADYVAVVNQSDTQLSLEGWVTITNNSGGDYEDAKLKLVAGDVHQVQRERVIAEVAGVITRSKAAPQFSEEAFFEYHLYSLERRTTIHQNEIKQISLFEAAEVTTEKLYVYEPAINPEKVMVKLEFMNSQEAGLGMPLPKGLIRVYKEDQDKALQFAGEDRIDHTSKDEKFRVLLGYAFDISVERVRKDYDRVSDRVREEVYQIKFRNHKEDDIQINLLERFYGDWFIKDCNVDFEKKDANTAELQVKIPAGKEKTVEFSVRITS